MTPTAREPATSDSKPASATPTPSKEAPAPGVNAEEGETFELTLDEYCRRRSAHDRRPELIGAFFADETAAGRVKDSEAAFDERFDAFANRPVS